MILTEPRVDAGEFELRTGWSLQPEGLCRPGICVPLPAGAARDGMLDARTLAKRLKLPLLRDRAHGLWCLGPSAGGRALVSARLPTVVLPDRHGTPFAVDSLRGRKVLLVAWASW